METKNGEATAIQRVIHEMVPTQQQSGGVMDVDVLAIIERRNSLLDKLLSYAISATHSGQWTDQDGKPFPTAAAAEVMARRCAVSISNVKSNKVPSNDDKGPFYLYVITCEARLPGGFGSFRAIDSSASRPNWRLPRAVFRRAN